jgi:phosphoglycolate phosphatase-like HAD superfamily hydrolase
VTAPPRAVLFDLDETLTDRPASLRRFAWVFAAAYEPRLAPIDAVDLETVVVAARRCRGNRKPREHRPAAGQAGQPLIPDPARAPT